MQEQPSVFDGDIIASLPIRRRDLLSGFHKVYLWIVFAIGVIFFLAGCSAAYGAITTVEMVINSSDEILAYKRSASERRIVALMALLALIPGIAVMLQALLVWWEKKWAIWFNWATAIGWALLLVVLFEMKDLTTLILLIPIALFAPYWTMLYRIWKDWEKNAVSKKDYRNVN